MKRAFIVESLPQAFEIIKEMNSHPTEWEADYREAGRKALSEILEGRMKDWINNYLEEIGRRGGEDRRNGYFSRHLLTELGDIELNIPRTRKASAVEVIRSYARRGVQIDRLILSCFVLGISTRKVAQALMPVLGEPISATVVSRVAKRLDRVVEAFHRRPIKKKYRFLVFDGVVLKRRSGAGAIKRVVLVALGITPEGRKEVIDFLIAPGESQRSWEEFLNDLYRRGVSGEGIEMVITDGGKGLLAALSLVYPRSVIQRCWAHKSRNVLNYIRKVDWELVKKDLHKISHAKSLSEARRALGDFCVCWGRRYPKAVKCLITDEEQLLNFFQIKDSSWWSQIRTTNAIERRFREVKRRTRPMGVFSDRTSMERILFAVFTYENLKEGTITPFLTLTQNN